MLLVNLHGITKFYGGRRILHELDFAVNEKVRIGLVGPNGAGKSTLLRIIAGLDDIQAGENSRRKGLRVAYLPQDIYGDPKTPLDLLETARADLVEIEEQLHQCEAELADPDVIGSMERMERILARQERLLARFEELGGPGYLGEARSRLRALGLDDAAMTQPMTELSGGERKLVALAVCLVQRPELLLLDEPETHLDLPHRQQLEVLIRDFEGAVVIVSHDRYLLDETVNQIAELDGEKVKMWSGNYSSYTLQRKVALLRQQEVYVAQQKEIARLEEAIARFKLWASLVVNERHIKQARNKQRQIDAMEKVERPVLARRKMALQLHSAVRGGQKVVELRHASMAFDDQPVLVDVDLLVRRGERVGIVGANGAGKSVLCKLLTGEFVPVEGERWVGPSIDSGYFAQGHETLDLDSTPLDLVRAARPYYENQAVALLGKFLFSYQQVRQPVHTLSGGERSRLALLLLMLGNANCLVLDEPTNHLDIDSAEVLEAALEDYEGTVVVVSHDRYFLDRIADHIVEVEGGEVKSYEGGYSAWVEARAPQPEPAADVVPSSQRPFGQTTPPPSLTARRLTAKRF
jgi:ATP-binding cassette, subfamily F, member 3